MYENAKSNSKFYCDIEVGRLTVLMNKRSELFISTNSEGLIWSFVLIFKNLERKTRDDVEISHQLKRQKHNNNCILNKNNVKIRQRRVRREIRTMRKNKNIKK